jgi:hypothetical protein
VLEERAGEDVEAIRQEVVVLDRGFAVPRGDAAVVRGIVVGAAQRDAVHFLDPALELPEEAYRLRVGVAVSDREREVEVAARRENLRRCGVDGVDVRERKRRRLVQVVVPHGQVAFGSSDRGRVEAASPFQEERRFVPRAHLDVLHLAPLDFDQIVLRGGEDVLDRQHALFHAHDFAVDSAAVE